MNCLLQALASFSPSTSLGFLTCTGTHTPFHKQETFSQLAVLDCFQQSHCTLEPATSCCFPQTTSLCTKSSANKVSALLKSPYTHSAKCETRL